MLYLLARSSVLMVQIEPLELQIRIKLLALWSLEVLLALWNPRKKLTLKFGNFNILLLMLLCF